MVSLSALENNKTVEVYLGDRLLNLKNGTLIYLKTAQKYQDNELNELLYVVIVIMFYAIALMVLIATQIKRSKREGQEVDYYDEYLQRNSAMYQRKQMQEKMMQRVHETVSSNQIHETVYAPGQVTSHQEGCTPCNKPDRLNLESIPDAEV